MRRATKQRILAVFVYVTSTSFLFLLSQRYFLVLYPSLHDPSSSSLSISHTIASDSGTDTTSGASLLKEFDVSPAVFGIPLNEVAQDSSKPVLIQPIETLLCDSSEIPHPLSPEGNNVAIMVQRGGCSFETKARNVVRLYQKKNELVKYLIIYDNVEYSSNDTKLIRMTSDSNFDEDPMDIPLSLLFISKTTAASILQIQSPILVSLDFASLHANTTGSTQPNAGKTWRDYITAEIVFVGMKLLVSLVITLFSLVLTAVALSCVWRDGLTIEVTSQGVIISQLEEEHEIDPVTLLSEEQVQKLPEVEYSIDTSGSKPKDGPMTCHISSSSCSICLEDYNDGERLRVLPCGHMYHTECISPWLTTRAPNCPLCKESFEPELPAAARLSMCGLRSRRYFGCWPRRDENESDDEDSIATSSHNTIPIAVDTNTNTTPRRRTAQRNQSIPV